MKQGRLQPSAQELILCKDPNVICETYLFEPSADEERLGFLFAAAETEDRGGIGKPLLDSVMTAIQREYYRQPERSPSTSFEMALHQANLLLYDTQQSGVRDWMGHFHVAVGVLAGSHLHISVAGAGAVLLARKTHVTNISQGISHFPITDPLKTFAQVASGEVEPRDALFFTSAPFESLFSSAAVGRFALEHSASTIGSRLEQLYLDQGHRVSLSVTVVTVLPAYIANPKQETTPPKMPAERRNAVPSVSGPRSPLIIKRSYFRQAILLTRSIISYIWNAIATWVWPAVKTVSRGATKKIHTLSIPKPSLPKFSLTKILRWAFSLPKSSKLFAAVAVVLFIALGISIVLLQHKRVTDATIEAASQKLHEARTKVDAAKTALIYDNRDQASGLLADATKITQQLMSGTLYQQETRQLMNDITQEQDRLQKIFRTNAVNTKTLGTFSGIIKGKNPSRLFFVNGGLYAASSETNAIAKMGTDGKAELVHNTTAGIGFITGGNAQGADKTILFGTDPAGIALFDTKDNSLTSQAIDLHSSPSAFFLFGNRLYAYDEKQENIFSYSKTLRGFTGGSPWITDANAQKKDIVSIAIDGNIYTLGKNGKIQRLFRGAVADFVQASVDPSLSSATRILTDDTMQNMYVLDGAHKRVVVFTKKGALVRQLFFENVVSLTDIALSPDETHLYALEGANVLDVTLTEDTVAK